MNVVVLGFYPGPRQVASYRFIVYKPISAVVFYITKYPAHVGFKIGWGFLDNLWLKPTAFTVASA